MVTTLGTILGTTLGTELGGMQDVAGFDSRLLYALSSFSAANYYATQVGGGEAGVSTGFGGRVLLRLDAPSHTADQSMFGSLGATPNKGWFIQLTSGGLLRGGIVSGTPSLALSSTYMVNASDVGKVLDVCVYFTGTVVRLLVNGIQYGADVAVTGYTPNTEESSIGRWTTQPFARGVVISAHTFRGTPSNAQILDSSHVARALGDVPTSFTGATVTHRWSLRDVLAGLDLPVVDGQTAPASLPDTVTAATVDRMDRQGSPIVRVIDPSVDGRKTYGALGGGTTAYLESPPDCLLGTPAGFHLRWRGRIHAGGSSRVIATNRDLTGSRGWGLWISSNNLTFLAKNSTPASINLTLAALTSADWGQEFYVHVQHTGTTLEGYVRRGSGDLAVVTPVAISGYTPSAAGTPLHIGDGFGLASDGIDHYDFDGGHTVLTLAEAQAASVDAARAGSLVRNAKTEHGWHLTADILANGGPENGIPATVQDRIGTDHLTRVGTGLQVAQRAERVWSYEASPILYGAGDFTIADYLAAAAGAAGDAVAFGGTLVWRPRATTTSVTRVLVSSRVDTPNRGFDIRTGATNATVSMIMRDGSGANVTSGSGVLSSAVGKVCVYSFQFDGTGSRLRTYLNRAEVGTGVSIAGYSPPPGAIRLGAELSGASAPGTDNEEFGFMLWTGLASLAQVQSQHDAILANDGRIQPLPGIPSAMFVDISAAIAANGGTLPATVPDNAGGNHFTRVGAPTTAAQYARAFGF